MKAWWTHLVGSGFFLEEAVEILEKTLIARALETHGNRSAAAKQLGIHRNTLQRKMVQYQLKGARSGASPRFAKPAAPESARPASVECRIVLPALVPLLTRVAFRTTAVARRLSFAGRLGSNTYGSAPT